MSVKDVVREIEGKMKKTIEAVSREFSEVRTGRAHPGLIEGVHVDYYGTPTMIKQIASISIPDAKTVVIQPWDVSAIPMIEQAINQSKLGIMPSNDGKVIRLSIPPLSKERREELRKVVKEMAEKGRVSLRSIRREANDKIKKMEQDKQASKDDSFNGQEAVQKLTDKFIKEVDDVLVAKDKELVDYGV
ncbi:MAG TPA: ribosome recycling factor [Candidatus Omnitrophota bacterium]|nr:ribosome recycling factor [Candidatus Omnitrophota bacterium]HQL41742.1 ribosome recycling factor [Candidatus Omnitrophota bacterium]